MILLRAGGTLDKVQKYVIPRAALNAIDYTPEKEEIISSFDEPKESVVDDTSHTDIPFLNKIVYNRVGKCGSRSLLAIISHLEKVNHFTLYNSEIHNVTRPSLVQLLQEVKLIDQLSKPVIYLRHIHYINFHKYGLLSPIYINMIRDPIERFSSHYHYQRYGDGNKAVGRRSGAWDKGEKDMDINECILTNHSLCSSDKGFFYIVPYFCGQDPVCQSPSEQSLAMAKLHVVENYLIVGYLEDFSGMVEVLEKILPGYFKGAMSVWNQIAKSKIDHTSTRKKLPLTSTAYSIMTEKLAIEYEFYHFIKTRFKILKRQLGLF